MEKQIALDALGQETLDHIAQALWLPEFDATQISPEILDKLVADKNSNKAFAARLRARLNDLLAHPESFSSGSQARYQVLLQHMDTLTPHQSYALGNLLGADSNRGFKEIPDTVHLQFPQDHLADLKSSVGWYFIVGSCTDHNNVEYGVLLMFMRVCFLPPALAESFGLSDLENQAVDFQFAINRQGDAHYQAVPLCVAGTTGLIDYSINPFLARYGKNEMRSLQNDDLFPLQVRARGVDRGKNPPVEMEIDFLFPSAKGILLQGKDGMMSIGGVGTYYYSIPNLVLDPAKSRLRINGKEVALKEGQFWFDHQWGVLGSPRPEILRAAGNLAPSSPSGWDWFELHFDGDRQITVVGMHSHENLAFYFQERATPPGVMTVKVNGKYMDENKKTVDVTGTLRVTDWVQNSLTPDPAHYPPTQAWYPNRWEFQFDAAVPQEISKIILVPLTPTGSLLHFTGGGTYQEAPVHILDVSGKQVGRGYAEAVHYADTNKTILTLAGMPVTPEMLALFQTPTPSLMTRIWSAVDVRTHQDELKKIVSSAPL